MTLAGLLQGVAVVLALEGIAYALAPGLMRRGLAALAATPEEALRIAGLLAATLGIGLAWLLSA